MIERRQRRRRLSFTSYGEVVLDDAVAVRNHPAFSKLFVESEYLADRHALLFQRRPRSPRDEPACLIAHAGAAAQWRDAAGTRSVAGALLGRRGHPLSPPALRSTPPRLSCSTGSTLDPVMALSAEVDLPPHRTRQLAFVTLAAESRHAALALADAHHSLPDLEWTFELARSQSDELSQITARSA